MRFTRAHFMQGVRTSNLPEWADACLIVSSRQIKSYSFAQPERWASYQAIWELVQARSTNYEGRVGAKIVPFAQDDVFTTNEAFAPLRIVLPDNRPLRGVLSYTPVYPERGFLGVPRSGSDLALVYAALAMLNSPLAKAWYDLSSEVTTPGGINRKALERLPIVSREASEEEIVDIAFAVHQIVSLYEATEEDGLEVSDLVHEARNRLELLLMHALHMPEREYDQVKKTMPSAHSGSYAPNLSDDMVKTAVAEGSIVSLVSKREREDFEALNLRSGQEIFSPAETEYYRVLRAKYHWQEVLSTPPPRWITSLPYYDPASEPIGHNGSISVEKAA